VRASKRTAEPGAGLHGEAQSDQRVQNAIDGRARDARERLAHGFQQLIGRGVIVAPGERLENDGALDGEWHAVSPACRPQALPLRLGVPHVDGT
jgi:hypothetical protein